MFRTVRLFETCRVSWQNKFVKLVYLVGFITNKFVAMPGPMNVKFEVSSIVRFLFTYLYPVHYDGRMKD
jgi:hypothetical protein